MATVWALHTHAQCYCNILQDKNNQVGFKYKLRVHAHVCRQLDGNTLQVQLVCFVGLFFRQTCTFQLV